MRLVQTTSRRLPAAVELRRLATKSRVEAPLSWRTASDGGLNSRKGRLLFSDDTKGGR